MLTETGAFFTLTYFLKKWPFNHCKETLSKVRLATYIKYKIIFGKQLKWQIPAVRDFNRPEVILLLYNRVFLNKDLDTAIR